MRDPGLRAAACRALEEWHHARNTSERRGKNPLETIQETRSKRKAEKRKKRGDETARGSETRSFGGSNPPITDMGAAAKRMDRIMRHIHGIDPGAYRALEIYAVRGLVADIMEVMGVSKATAYQTFEVGLMAIMMAISWRD